MDMLEPGKFGIAVPFKKRYENFIGGQWIAPVNKQYFDNTTPVTGKVFCEVARSTAADVELALDAAHKAKGAWGRTSTTERANILNKIADRIEANLPMLAAAETWDNGKPLRETMAADLPLTVDHFRYFAGCIRAQDGGVSEIDHETFAYHYHEPIGVVGLIIPWNFPILMATWKLAPALAAGNCVVLKPAEQTPVSILMLVELIADLLPPGVLNVVNGFGLEAGKPLASSNRIGKIAFTGETTTGRLISQYASQNLIPVTLELGGKSPNVFFADVMEKDDGFFDKALEGFAMFALNQGEVCTCPSRALVQESIYERFIERAIKRVAAITQGNPLDPTTMIGAQASSEQLEKILSYLDIGRQEGAKCLIGGKRARLEGEEPGAQAQVHLGREVEGNHGGLAEIGHEDVLLEKARAVAHASAPGVLQGLRDQIGIELDAHPARAKITRGGDDCLLQFHCATAHFSHFESDMASRPQDAPQFVKNRGHFRLPAFQARRHRDRDGFRINSRKPAPEPIVAGIIHHFEKGR